MNTKYVFFTIMISLFFLIGYTPKTSAEPVTADIFKGQADTRIGDQSTMAVLWSQISAEKEALYYQGYYLGKQAIDQSLTKSIHRKRAIVLDIDETVLDNSPYFAYLVKSGKDFPYGWDEWVKSATAKPLPGAKEFLNYVDAKKIDIFYISNRSDYLMEGTIKNLKKQGFPQVNENHVFLQSNTSNKGPRIQQLKKNHTIVSLFGDNLGDFADVFNGKTTKERSTEVKKLKDEFGSKFIVFPNPMYGDWDWTLYHYDFKIKSDEKVDIRRKAMLPYRP